MRNDCQRMCVSFLSHFYEFKSYKNEISSVVFFRINFFFSWKFEVSKYT